MGKLTKDEEKFLQRYFARRYHAFRELERYVRILKKLESSDFIQ